MNKISALFSSSEAWVIGLTFIYNGLIAVAHIITVPNGVTIAINVIGVILGAYLHAGTAQIAKAARATK